MQLGLGGVVAIPKFRDSDSFIFVQGTFGEIGYKADPTRTESWVIPGEIAAGTHSILDVWDGVSRYMGGTSGAVQQAGDVNDDGHMDMWFGARLLPGPFLGRGTEYDDPAVAWFPIGTEGGVVATGFEANRDQHDDIVMNRGYRRSVVFYGPFEGQLASFTRGDADPSTVTVLGDDGCPTNRVAWILRDHLGPGHHAIALGNGSSCGFADTYFFDLMQLPGTHLASSEAFAWAGDWSAAFASWVDDPGDVDEDGHPDVLRSRGYTDRHLLAGPVSGDLSQPIGDDVPAALDELDTTVFYAIGDLNRDGVQEIVAQFWPDGVSNGDAWSVILFSPHTNPLYGGDGLPIDRVGNLSSTWRFGAYHADLDGDGLQDVIDTMLQGDEAGPELAYAGEIRIWYGKDLLAAYEERIMR